MQSQTPFFEPGQAVPVPWYYRKWFVVVALLFVFPVGLVLLWKSPVTKLSGRIVWSVIVGLSFLAWVGSRGNAPKPTASPSKSVTSPAPVTTSTQQPQAVQPSTQQTPPASAPTLAPKPAAWRLTADMYARVTEGMPYQQVVQIIGKPGEELSSSEIAGIKTVMYMWQNPDGSNMNATFQNDSLVMKAQFALK